MQLVFNNFSKTRQQNLKKAARLFQFDTRTCVVNFNIKAILWLQCTYSVSFNKTRPLFLGLHQCKRLLSFDLVLPHSISRVPDFSPVFTSYALTIVLLIPTISTLGNHENNKTQLSLTLRQLKNT